MTRTGVTLEDSSGLFVLHSGDAATVTLAGPEWYRGNIVCVFDSSAPDGRPADTSPMRVGSSYPVDGPTVLIFWIADDGPIEQG